MSDDKNYYHNQGEKDGVEGNYNPPHGIFTGSLSQSNVEENKAYDKGYSHGKGQIDGRNNNYDSGYSGSNSYNSGWDNGYSSGGGSSSSGGCFITTATLNQIGKLDDCEELNLFRSFRDNWLQYQKDGHSLISDYYMVAPKIVGSINNNKLKNEIYEELWEISIKPCLELIKNKQFREAKNLYCKTVFDLKNKYLTEVIK